MTASSPEPTRSGDDHIDRLLGLVAEVDFVEQLARAEHVIDRRRDELLRQRQAATRTTGTSQPKRAIREDASR